MNIQEYISGTIQNAELPKVFDLDNFKIRISPDKFNRIELEFRLARLDDWVSPGFLLEYFLTNSVGFTKNYSFDSDYGRDKVETVRFCIDFLRNFEQEITNHLDIGDYKKWLCSEEPKKAYAIMKQ